MKEVIACFVVLLLVSKPLAGNFPFDCAFLEQELKTGAVNYIEFKQVSDKPIIYRAWGIWNFPHPIQSVAQVALDFEHYSRIFHYVYRCERITSPVTRISPLGTWYVEGRAVVARVWSIGNIDTLCWADSSHLKLVASQNQDRTLETKWSESKPGWWNFRTYNLHFAAFIVSSGKDSCRLGVMAQGMVVHPMPDWLVRLTLRIILPQLLEDIENEIILRTKISDTDASWKKLYHVVRRFFSPFF